MKLKHLPADDLSQAQALIWETFLAYEAPDYAQEGIRYTPMIFTS